MAALTFGNRLINITDERVSELITSEQSADRVFAVVDGDGRVIFDIDKDGNFIRNNIESNLDTYTKNYIEKYFRSDSQYLFAIVDDSDKVIFSIDRSGKYSIDEQVFNDIDTCFTNQVFNSVFSIVDTEGKVLFSIDKNGKYSIDSQVHELISKHFEQESPLVYAVTDAEGKLLIGFTDKGELRSAPVDNRIAEVISGIETMDYAYVDNQVDIERRRAEGAELELRTAIDEIEPTVVVGGDNNPDEEFLTSIDEKLTIKNVSNAVNSNNTVYLHKGDNLSQVFTAPNTTYVITFTHDLAGGELIIPLNSELFFVGGCLYNGTIVGNNTKIRSLRSKCFGIGLDFSGSFDVTEIHSNYFVESATTNELKKINVLLSPTVFNRVIIDSETVAYFEPLHDGGWQVVPDYLFNLENNTEVVVDGVINVVPNKWTHYEVIRAEGKRNVSIKGNGILAGDADTHDYMTIDSTHEWCHGVVIRNNSENVSISGLKIQGMPGDGIDCDGGKIPATGVAVMAKNCHIHDVSIYHCGRQGITIGSAENVIVENCIIDDIYRVAPMAAIDIEPWTDLKARNIALRNIRFSGSMGIDVAFCENVKISTVTGENSRLFNFWNCNDVSVDSARLNDNSNNRTVVESFGTVYNVSLNNVTVNTVGTTNAVLDGIQIKDTCNFGPSFTITSGPSIGSTRVAGGIYEFYDGTQWKQF